MSSGTPARLIASTALLQAAQALLLFGVAGTVRWTGAWLYLIEAGGLSLAIGLALARHDPALLAERLAWPIQRAQPRWDRQFMIGAMTAWVAWMIVMALDAGRYRWSEMSVALQAAGAVAIGLGLAIVHLTFRANSFSAPVVKIQADRGHRVITTGPYRFVRHPMYAGAVVYLLGVALLLGSWCGVVLVPVLVAGLSLRVVLEERTLAARLEGYGAYAARVRYRLIPGVW